MFAIVKNNEIKKFIPVSTAFAWEDNQYADNWIALADDADKAAIGLVEVVWNERPDPTFYDSQEATPAYSSAVKKVVINYTKVAKDVALVKQEMVSEANALAYSTLQPSDWMAVSAFETGTKVDPAWSAWRQSVRDATLANIKAINACSNIEELAALVPTYWNASPTL
jgi:hypothetical protein